MSASPLDSSLYGRLMGDEELGPLFTPEKEVEVLLQVEAALAKVQASVGLIPEPAASEIARAVSSLVLDPATLADGTAANGIPIPSLVRELRKAVAPDASGYVHFGATSQDIMDTALVLRVREAVAVLSARLDQLISILSAKTETFQDTAVPARTRSQQATPTALGLKFATWLMPLKRHRQRLVELRPRLEVVQLGGAAGNLSAFGEEGLNVMTGLASEFNLGAPAIPWHTQRDNLVEFTGLLSLLVATLGKIGHDLILLGQSEIREIRAGTGGGSSTMPQKSNPVGAEVLASFARHIPGLQATMISAAVHPSERDGSAWIAEWMTLPQIVLMTGKALSIAIDLSSSVEADEDNIRAVFERSNDLMMAEAAAFKMAAHIPLPEAQRLVKDAARKIAKNGGSLIDELAESCGLDVDWQSLRQPSEQLGSAQELIARATAD